MPKSNVELRVGIFVLLGLAIFVFAIFSIGDLNLLRSGYFIRVRFDDIAGLTIGAPVELIGVKIGEVKSISIVEDKDKDEKIVELKVWIKNGYTIKETAAVRLRRLGLMGEQYVHFTMGKKGSPDLKEGDVLYGEDLVGIDEVTREVYEAAQEFKATLTGINEVTKDPKFHSDLKEIAENTKNASKNLEDLTADLKANPWKLFIKPNSTKKQRKSKDTIDNSSEIQTNGYIIQKGN
jgi:phospholipid/cholesterol/gamma-HCH transport system substrate-binding protein